MTREDLVSLCDEYVRSREEAAEMTQQPTDPASEILRSFTLAEISECEMEALLAYVGDPDDEDNCQAAVVAIDRFDDPHADIWQDDDEPAWQSGQPR